MADEIETFRFFEGEDVPPEAPSLEEPWWTDYKASLSGPDGSFKKLGSVLLHPRRPNAGGITVVDYLNASAQPVVRETLELNSKEKTDRSSEMLKTLGTDIPEEVTTRVIIAEDLSRRVILRLGAALQVDPAVFAQHLQNSTYVEGKYDETDKRNRLIESTTKNYFSMRWFRPVYRNRIPFNYNLDQLLLTNPQQNIQRWDTTEESMAKDGITRSVIKHEASMTTNILRREWPIGVHETTADIATGWEEKVTVWTTEIGNCQIYLILLDPLPLLKEKVTGNPKYVVNLEDADNPWLDPSVSRKPMSNATQGMLWLSVRRQRTMPSDTETGKTEPGPTSLTRTRSLCFFKQLNSRCPQLVSAVPDSTQTKSALQDYLEWLHVSHRSYSNSGPLIHIFRMMHADTLDFLEVANNALVEIREHDLDDVLIQDQVQRWRSFMSRLDREIPLLERSIRLLSKFIHTWERGSESRASELEASTKEIFSRFAWLEKQIVKTNKGILASLSLADSRRSILEAHSVTKLTELAFFFIPLTFSASVLSMQVKELQGGVSIGIFFALAAGFILLAYILRMVLRSRNFSITKSKTMSKVRSKAGISRSTPVPAGMFIRTAAGLASEKMQWQRSRLRRKAASTAESGSGKASKVRLVWRFPNIRWTKKPVIMLLLYATLAAPLVFLWKRHISTSYKAVITILLFCFTFPLVFIIGYHNGFVDFLVKQRDLQLGPLSSLVDDESDEESGVDAG